jgi:hypothetical protein
MPWHAVWDTGRTLVNRAFGSDHPGTLGIRRSTFVELGGYDGDVLFENLELVRTFRAAHARVVDRPDLYVVRRPPSVQRFWSQRIRQAYDDLAQPVRLARHLAVVPAVFGLRRRPGLLALGAASVVAVAELGRRRAGGADRFPVAGTWCSLAWVLERGVTVWVAVAGRFALGGCPYAGIVIPRAASGVRRIRRRLERQRTAPTGTPGVRPVAERGEPRPAASTERDRRSTDGELPPVLIDERDVAAHDEGPVRVHVDRAAHLRLRSPG